MCNTHFILGEGTQEGASLRTGGSGNRKSADDANQPPRTKGLAPTPAKPREGICSYCCTAQGARLWLRPGTLGGGAEGPGCRCPRVGASPHVWASESSSRPPFPRRYLARSFLVTSPTTCRNNTRSESPHRVYRTSTPCDGVLHILVLKKVYNNRLGPKGYCPETDMTQCPPTTY